MDCTYAASYNGCNGGSTGAALTYLYKAGGAQKNSDYPFTSGSTGKSNSCKFVNSKAYAKLANTGTLVSSNETLMQQALVTYGPLSHYYYVSNNFYSYKWAHYIFGLEIKFRNVSPSKGVASSVTPLVRPICPAWTTAWPSSGTVNSTTFLTGSSVTNGAPDGGRLATCSSFEAKTHAEYPPMASARQSFKTWTEMNHWLISIYFIW